MSRRHFFWILLILFFLPIVFAQTDASPKGRFVIAGYGDTTYSDGDNMNSGFNTRIVPILLFKISDQLHVETEVEGSFGENGELNFELEYADIHYFIGESTTITAGKFLLPFGQFGPNLHPSWVNKLPSVPAPYGSHGSSSVLTPLIPVFSDVGVSVQKVFKLKGTQKIFFDAYMTQGPRLEGGHNEEGEEGHDEKTRTLFSGFNEDDELGGPPELGFEATSGDNNNNKALGGRLAYAWLPGFEAGYSYYQAAYDDDSLLDFKASNLDLNYISRFWQLRGEFIQTETDFFAEHDEDDEEDEGDHGDEEGEDTHGDELELGAIQTFDREGFYVQGVLQLGITKVEFLNPLELVGRYSEVRLYQPGSSWTMGLNYWLSSSAVVKFAYQNSNPDEGESQKKLSLQISYGF